MKILQLHPIMKTINGSERMLIEWNNRLLKDGYQSYIAALNVDKECKKLMSEKTVLFQSKFNFNRNTGIFLILQLVFYPLLILPKLIISKPVDIIIAHNSNTMFTAIIYSLLQKIFKGKIIQLILLCQEPPRFVYDLKNVTKKRMNFVGKIFFEIFTFIFRKFDKFLVKKADNVLANSIYSKGIIEQIYNRHDVMVTYPGVNFSHENKQVNLNVEYDIPEDAFILLSVGKLHTRKNFEFQIKCLKQLLKAKHNVHLIIVGKGPEKGNLERLVKNLNLKERVTLTGFVADELLYSYYDQADLFTFSAYREPFGIVVIEAMANNKAVVVPNEGGPAEICIDSKTGFVYKQGNKDDFIKKVLKLIENREKRNNFQKNAIQRAKLFTWDNSYQKLTKIIERKL